MVTTFMTATAAVFAMALYNTYKVVTTVKSINRK